MTRQVSDMATPDTCLSPATCYHVYHLHSGKIVPAAGTVHGVCGKCFRFESTNTSDLRRLWDFTMREVVFMGTREQVSQQRESASNGRPISRRASARIGNPNGQRSVLRRARCDGEDVFSAQLRNEVRDCGAVAGRPATGDRIARTITPTFLAGRSTCSVEGGGFMHSVCIAFGIERCVYAFLRQHGTDPARWPDVVRRAFSS